jgi:hypothetical protein
VEIVSRRELAVGAAAAASSRSAAAVPGCVQPS